MNKDIKSKQEDVNNRIKIDQTDYSMLYDNFGTIRQTDDIN